MTNINAEAIHAVISICEEYLQLPTQEDKDIYIRDCLSITRLKSVSLAASLRRLLRSMSWEKLDYWIEHQPELLQSVEGL